MLKRNIIWTIAILLSVGREVTFAQESSPPVSLISPKAEVYGLVYRWTLPPTSQEQELVSDFKTIADLAAQHGATSSHLYRGTSANEYIGIQFWPSKSLYSTWFDQKTFRFQGTQSQEHVDLIKKIKDVYKNKLLTEISQQVL